MSYIGTQPVPQSLQSRQQFTGDGSTTTFATIGGVELYEDVFLNGVRLSRVDNEYSFDGTTLTITPAPANGDTVSIILRNDRSELIALPITDSQGNNVLSESGSVVTLTADEANVGSNALVVNSSGNVGVGTSSPSYKLHVFGGSGSATVAKFFATNYGNLGTTYIELGTEYGDGGSRIGNVNPTGNYGTLVFETMTNTSGVFAERMRIDSSGAITMPNVYDDTVTGRDLYISSSGQLGYVSSIRSSKTNIENLPSISWLYELTPVKFQYRTKDEDGNYTDEADSEIQYGFIAEDVVEVNSDLVFGDETENGFELRGIQYSRLIGPMIKAIQEQQALIESQQSQIDALTARIEALETA